MPSFETECSTRQDNRVKHVLSGKEIVNPSLSLDFTFSEIREKCFFSFSGVQFMSMIVPSILRFARNGLE